MKISTRRSLIMLFAGALFVAQRVAPDDATAADFTAWPTDDWTVAKPEDEGMSSAGLEKLRDYLHECGSKAGLVVRHGRIVGEWYWDEATASTPYLVYSTTKSVASTAAGLAIARGKLTLDSRVGEFLPNVSPPEKRDITVRQILSMSTGVKNNPDLRKEPDLFAYALERAPMAYAPGEHWEYNNTGLALLGPLFAKATGEAMDVFLDRELFTPIGIKKSDWSWEHSEGHAIPFSGLHITPRSLARFGLVFLNGGKWQERQIVPAAWVAEATRSSQDLNKSYGYLWWNNLDGKKWKGVPADAYAALGRSDNNMYILPTQEMIVIREVGDDKENHKVDQAKIAALAVQAIDERTSR